MYLISLSYKTLLVNCKIFEYTKSVFSPLEHGSLYKHSNIRKFEQTVIFGSELLYTVVSEGWELGWDDF